jgi:hypothetical protein
MLPDPDFPVPDPDFPFIAEARREDAGTMRRQIAKQAALTAQGLAEP